MRSTGSTKDIKPRRVAVLASNDLIDLYKALKNLYAVLCDYSTSETIMKKSRCVAVVGAACRFPGGETLDEFWETLFNGRNLVQRIPVDRWNVDAFYSPDKEAAGKNYVQHAALLSDIRTFDNKIFNITDEEARYMDVQQKMVLEVSYKAFEDAGLSANDVRGTNTAVFMGQMNDDYAQAIAMDEVVTYSSVGIGRAVVSNRVSYQFDLRGPSASIDTACSSSLMCLHLGVQSILSGESTMAVCGGVSAILTPNPTVPLSKAGMASLSGQCSTFSDSADGYVRGEGCGVVIIKELDQALRDKNHIWCLLATGANQDGSTVSPITTPSSAQQEALIRRLYRDCEVDLDWIDVIEAHGTGTRAGDPIETKALGNTIGAARLAKAKGPCAIGSLKTNIGHLESAAGIAGIIKAILMLKHQKIVPSLHFTKPNPYIDFAGLNVSVATEVTNWPQSDDGIPHLACVNSFGYGGTNVHAILQDFSPMQPSNNDDAIVCQTRPWPVLLSAASFQALLATLKHTRDYLTCTSCDLKSLAYTSSVKRTHFRFRSAFLVNSVDELKKAADQRMLSLQQQTGNLGPTPRNVHVVFVFCGMGTTYVGMGSELFRLEPVFAEALREVDKLIKKFMGWSVIEKMNGGEGEDALSSPEFSQPALFAIQVSLVKLLRSWGLVPNDVIGHSVGEVAASYASNRLSLEDATKVICYRGQLMARVSGGLMMVAENFPPEVVDDVIQRHHPRVHVAAVNATNCYTLSGDADAINDVEKELKAVDVKGNQVLLKKLTVNTAFHSHHMDPIKDDLLRALSSVKQMDTESGITSSTVYSTVTGKQAVAGDLTDADYWVQNARGCVYFKQAFAECLKAASSTPTCVVEIGPRPALGRYMKNIAAEVKAKPTVLATLKPPSEARELYTTLTKLFEDGLDVQWKKVFEGHETELCPVPKYQFQKKELWHDIRKFQQNRLGVAGENGSVTSSDAMPHCFLRKSPEDEATFVARLNAPETDFVKDHQLARVPTVAGSMYLECGLAAVWLSSKARLDRISVSVNFNRLLMLPETSDQTKTMDVSLQRRRRLDNEQQQQHQQRTVVESFDYEVTSNGVQHASGIAELSHEPRNAPSPVDLNEIKYRCTASVDRKSFYERLNKYNFWYGKQFAAVQSVLHSSGEFRECLATVNVCDEVGKHFPTSVIHPCLGDCVLQLSSVMLNDQDNDNDDENTQTGEKNTPQMVPRCIRKVSVYRPPETSMFIHLKLISGSVESRFLIYDAMMLNKFGEVYAVFENVTISAIDSDVRCQAGECLYSLEWTPIEDSLKTAVSSRSSDEKSNAPAKYVVFEDKAGTARRLVTSLVQAGIPCADNVYLKANRNFVSNLQADMLTLDRHLPASLAEYNGILYFWPLDSSLSENMTGEEVHAVLSESCFSLCQLVKFLISVRSEIPITVVTKNACELMHSSPAGACNGGRVDQLALDESEKANLLNGVAGYTINAMVRSITMEPGCPPIRCIDMTRCDDDEINKLLRQLVDGDQRQQHPEISFFRGQIWKPELLPGYASFEPMMRRVDRPPTVPYTAVKAENADCCVLSPSHDLSTTTQSTNNLDGFIRCDVIKSRVDAGGLQQNRRKSGGKLTAADLLARTTATEKNAAEVKVHVLGPSSLESVQSVDSRRCVPYSLFPIDQPVMSIAYLAWYIAECTTAGKLLRCGQSSHISCNDSLPECRHIARLLKEMVTTSQSGPNGMKSLTVKLVCARKPQDICNLFVNETVVSKCHFVILATFHDFPMKRCFSNGLKEKVDIIYLPRLFESEIITHVDKFIQWLKSDNSWLNSQLKNMSSFDFGMRTLNSPDDFNVDPSSDVETTTLDNELSMLDLSMYNETVPLAVTTATLFQSTAHYVIIGGSRGLGWELIKHMAKLGAKCLISWSRRLPENNVRNEATIVERDFRCKIRFREVDVSSKEEVAEELAASRDELFPGTQLAGIYHGAVVLDDTAVVSMTFDRYARSLLPKVNGTWNLHQLTKDQRLEHFVLHSSIASVLGNPGQTNYVTGNAFQDSLAVYRRKIGLPGQSISWSGLAVGVIQNSQSALRRAQSMGLALLSVADIMECFNFALLSDRSHSVFARIEWRQLFRGGIKDTGYSRRMPLFSFFTKRYDGFLKMLTDRNRKLDDLKSKESDEAIDSVRAFIRKVFAENVPGFEDRPTDDADAYELGADSLNFMSIVLKLRKQFSIPENDLQATAFPTLTVNGMYAVVTKHVKPITPTTDSSTMMEDTSTVDELPAANSGLKKSGNAVLADVISQNAVTPHIRTRQ